MTSKLCEWVERNGLGRVVIAMLVLSLDATGTGVARFMAAMGYDTKVGYGVGIALELTFREPGTRFWHLRKRKVGDGGANQGPSFSGSG